MKASKLRHRIDLAGNPTGWDVERILAFKVIGLVCGVVDRDCRCHWHWAAALQSRRA